MASLIRADKQWLFKPEADEVWRSVEGLTFTNDFAVQVWHLKPTSPIHSECVVACDHRGEVALITREGEHWVSQTVCKWGSSWSLPHATLGRHWVVVPTLSNAIAISLCDLSVHQCSWSVNPERTSQQAFVLDEPEALTMAILQDSEHGRVRVERRAIDGTRREPLFESWNSGVFNLDAAIVWHAADRGVSKLSLLYLSERADRDLCEKGAADCVIKAATIAQGGQSTPFASNPGDYRQLEFAAPAGQARLGDIWNDAGTLRFTVAGQPVLYYSWRDDVLAGHRW